jgi:hypothetical protein
MGFGMGWALRGSWPRNFLLWVKHTSYELNLTNQLNVGFSRCQELFWKFWSWVRLVGRVERFRPCLFLARLFQQFLRLVVRLRVIHGSTTMTPRRPSHVKTKNRAVGVLRGAPPARRSLRDPWGDRRRA